MLIPCKVCSLESPPPDPIPASKYKCPKCLTPYCSVPCFKSHQCQKILISNPDHQLSQDQLSQILANSSNLTPNLLKLLEQIDASPTSNDAVCNLQDKRKNCKDLDDWCNSVLKSANNLKSGLTLLESLDDSSSDSSQSDDSENQESFQDQGMSKYIVH